MEFRDLKAQYKVLQSQIDHAVTEVMSEGNFIMGQQVSTLERMLAEYIGVKHCMTCANGTDALQLVLMAWGIGKGDIVFVPDFTFFSTAEVVSLVGGTPWFVDIDEDTFNIDPIQLECAIEHVLLEGRERPKAIITVDLFGQPANYIEIERIAKKYDLLLLEDGAQGFGGRIGERKACSFGDAATTSFFPSKPLGCYGDGGAVFTNDDDLAEKIKSLRVHGKGIDKYDNVQIGLNSRLDTIQAAILIEKMRAFEGYELEKINEVASWYNENLGDSVRKPRILKNYYSSWAQYTIQLENAEQREQVMKKLKEAHIPSMIYYNRPLHSQKAFEDIGRLYELEMSKQVCERVLSLPIHPYLNKEEVEEVCSVINSIVC